MRTPTNHEDNFMWREAAIADQRERRRKSLIEGAVSRGIVRIITELMDDYSLTLVEAMAAIRKNIKPKGKGMEDFPVPDD